MCEPAEHPCHIEVPHPRHPWWPLVADPEVERVLHLGLAELTCPGVLRTETG